MREMYRKAGEGEIWQKRGLNPPLWEAFLLLFRHLSCYLGLLELNLSVCNKGLFNENIFN